MKLIKVMDGLYRTEDGHFRIARESKWKDRPARWAVRFTNILNAPVSVEFRTLAEARRWLKDSHYPKGEEK